MNRPVHFEIHAANPERAVAFYQTVFGWTFKKWDGPAPYWLIDTGTEGPGINGGLVQRPAPAPAQGQGSNAYVITLGVASVDASLAQVLSHGGVEAMAKMAVPGVGWLAYAIDPEGNTFGMMQHDPTAK